MLNKKNIQHNFNKKSAEYNKNALLQQIIAEKLYNLAKDFIKDESKILDLGSGTSFIAKKIIPNHKKVKIYEIDFAKNMIDLWQERPSNIFPIIADIEKLPFKNHSYFDLILSSFSLQWLENFQETFQNLSNILNKNGKIIFSFPSETSLLAIKESSKKSGCNFFIKDLPKEKYIQDLIEKNTILQKIFIKNENLIESYSSGTEAIKSIKTIGANYQEIEKSKKSITKEKLQKFNDFFTKDYNNELLWNVCYFVYKK